MLPAKSLRASCESAQASAATSAWSSWSRVARHSGTPTRPRRRGLARRLPLRRTGSLLVCVVWSVVWWCRGVVCALWRGVRCVVSGVWRFAPCATSGGPFSREGGPASRIDAPDLAVQGRLSLPCKGFYARRARPRAGEASTWPPITVTDERMQLQGASVEVDVVAAWRRRR